MLLDWEQGLPIMGNASHPVPWAYVVGDRLLEEAHDTMRGMGIPIAAVRMIPAFGKDNKDLNRIIFAAQELDPLPELLVIEGFGDLVDMPGHRRQVRDFVSEVSSWCQSPRDFPNGLTILGVMESPKTKPNERYKDPRQRISGCAAWGYHSSTVFIIESEKPDALGHSQRVISVSMKNSLSFARQGDFDSNGRLVFP